MRTSEQELSAARAHFGEEAVAEFTAALEQSRADMVAAFEIRQQLDDEVPEDEPTKRSMYAEIIRTCRAADDRLDAQVEAFDRLRDLEAKAPAVHRRARHPAGRGQRPAPAGRAGAGRRCAAATPTPRWRRWPTTWSRPGGCSGVAGTEVADARADLTARGPAAAVVSGRAAEDAITQAETMLDGDPAAGGRADRRGRADPGVAGRADPGPGRGADHGRVHRRARWPGPRRRWPRPSRPRARPRPDPIGALRLLDEAGTALEQGLEQARADQDRARKAAAALEQALLTARSAVAAAEDFITTRRGAIGTEARTRLAEAQRHLQLAGRRRPGGRAAARPSRPTRWPSRRCGGAVRCGPLAGRRRRVAAGGGLGVDLGSLVLGGILSGAFGGEYRRGGGYGGGYSRRLGRRLRVAVGGRSPGSFGGSSTRGRRGGGGRF